MKYLQCVIQEGNTSIFRQIIAQEEGHDDFVNVRDLHGNTCLHYLALFDEEDLIICVLK